MKYRLATALTINFLILAPAAELFGQGEEVRGHRDFQSRTLAGQTRGAKDLKSLVAKLRSRRVTVKLGGRVEQPFFSVPGRELNVDGNTIQVFEYKTAARAEADSRKISEDGSPIGTTMITWVGPPHFFKSGRLIVLYIGENTALINALGNALGRQFAGK